MKNKKICIIGLGYIGLPTAALLSNSGFSVCGVDINEKIVSIVNEGKIHIIETGLDAFVKSAISNGKLKAYNKVQPSDIYIICVPTPFYKNKNLVEPNIEYVMSATKAISQFIKPGDLVILESTSPVGTTEKIKQSLFHLGANLDDVHIAYCPERVLPGRTMTELVENDRVIGGLSKESTKKIADFYRLFVDGNIFETDAKTAEMCKLTENSFRDVNIAFANELSMICDNKGVNVWDVIRLANKHPRVNILQPGTGVGGHCIAVDPWFLISQDPKNTKLIKTSREVNDFKTQWIINKIMNFINDNFSKSNYKPKIACLGLSFKPDIDDLRESKALVVVNTLLSNGCDVAVVEPNIRSYKNFKIIDLLEGIKKSDLVCILVKHREFLKPELKNELMKCKVFDFCGALS
jgi:UDP-N-acetyl-D-mannosaminuronic acid dehydrogenase